MTRSVRHLLFSVLVAAVFQPQIARAATNDGKGKYSNCQDDSDELCVDSFVWCSRDADECSFPEYTYDYRAGDPRDPNSLNTAVGTDNPALVLWNHDYNLVWNNTDPKKKVTVSWRWLFPQDGTDFPISLWTTDLDAGETSLIINFSKLATKPSESAKIYHLNTPKIQNKVASTTTVLEVSQGSDSNEKSSSSDPFVVFANGVTTYLDTQRELGSSTDSGGSDSTSDKSSDDDADNHAGKTDSSKKWKLGVGIGVGLGAPLLAALSFFAGSLYGKRRSRRAEKLPLHQNSNDEVEKEAKSEPTANSLGN
ncbi:hypothetical protein AK830_g7549 [Neonectria ditissima]|uniref:Mid2 domain-containing protein n=1 Tax=Neonectria ditissima TaxID=78410 RepID=A0A0P7B9X1_9HYPO|nr:hypothetical protein AK830_g7549 [Neonectria ditissima]